MVVFNELHAGYTYSPDAFNRLKEFVLGLYPYVARHATQKEEERIKHLTIIPDYLGGLGYD